MKIVKISLLNILALIIIFWGLRFTSPNLRIEGYSGLMLEYLFPNHDTEFSEKYSDEGFLKIKKGMNEQEVLKILGEPLERWTPQKNYDGFQYTRSKASTHYRLRQVYLTNGRVIEIIGYYYID